MIFDMRLRKKFRQKTRYVGGGQTTETPLSITYLFVVSRDSVRILLTIASSNELDIMACDIQNVHLPAKSRGMIQAIKRPEFGSEQGYIMIVEGTLYELKSSQAAFRCTSADILHNMNYMSNLADLEV